MATVYVAIGSNINAEANLRRCAALIRRIWEDVEFSSVYSTAAMEYQDQEDFLNAAARLTTDMPLPEVHARLQAIEQLLEKAPLFRFGPRTIDLDILLYDDKPHESDVLSIPHPRMHQRRFVLDPLCDIIDRDALHPVLSESWKSLLGKTLDQECDRTDMTL